MPSAGLLLTEGLFPTISAVSASELRQSARRLHAMRLTSGIGVYIEGLAGVLHECDIAVIEASEALFCRRTHVHPKKADVLLTAECKFYTGKLGIALGREFLGTTAELGTEGRFMLSNSDGRSVDRVLAHHKRKRHFRLTPLDPDSETQVLAQFREVFRNAIAKRR